MFETPILLLIFNREDTTRKVFEAIRQQKPKYLFVAADGARKHKPEEIERCRRVRDIIKEVDWDCEVKTLFREENLGCKIAVSSAITWFFDHVEQGIILEDDCLPDPSFFPFCEELLHQYKENERIGHISGNCFLPRRVDNRYSYDFSSITHIWGWATWRRVWKNVDVTFPFWQGEKQKRSSLFCNTLEKIYFTSFLSDALKNRNGLNPWAVFYYFSLRLQNQLSIYPAVNLVTNIGLDSEFATHTKKKSRKRFIPFSPIPLPLKHPHFILRNKQLDNASIKRLFFSWKRLVRYFLRLY
ncbi:hemolytic protein HlpA [Bacteroidia bacterium]|nr:hemolytic protein HlpA [Bacteroidia bacterium]